MLHMAHGRNKKYGVVARVGLAFRAAFHQHVKLTALEQIEVHYR